MRSFVELISAKRDSQSLSSDEWIYVTRCAADGSIPDYQLSALLMAAFIRGLTSAETAALVKGIRDSGDVLKVNGHGLPRVDKHSTGGVGDKISLFCAPLAASMGLCVPMLAGRGLGTTGGTVDKLESLPGIDLSLSPEQFQVVIDETGFCIAAQTKSIAPADRKLYALRDVTATVESIPLIVGSIMGKKLATDADGLALTVMWGSGAFMKTSAEAVTLARALAEAGVANGRNVCPILMDMNWPLGRYVGNLAEVWEADLFYSQGLVETRLWECVRSTVAAMLVAGGKVHDMEEGIKILPAGRQMETGMLRIDWSVREDAAKRWLGYRSVMGEKKPQLIDQMQVSNIFEINAEKTGYLRSKDCASVGRALIELGGGRKKLDDQIEPRVGIEVLVENGDWVEKDQPVLRIIWLGELDSQSAIYLESKKEKAILLLKDSFLVSDVPVSSNVIWSPLNS